MKMDDIKQELKGYFIYKNKTDYELGLKQGNDFTLITDNITVTTLTDKFKVSPIRYLLMQINNNLLDPTAYVNDLADVLEVIDFQMFKLYDDRNLEIEKHKELLYQIQESKSIFGRKKDFKLIYVKTHNYLDNNKEQIGYYVIKDKEVVPIDSALLDNTDNAVEVRNLQDLKKALKDDLVNQYFENYNQECRKWDKLN